MHTDTLCPWTLREGRALPTTSEGATLWIVDTPTTPPEVWPCLALVPTGSLPSTGLASVVPREAPWPVIHAALCATAMGLHVRPPQAPLHLTPREQQTLDRVALGYSNPEIARDLEISRHTAKFHVTALLEKLDATSRTEAAVRAASLGLLHRPAQLGRMSLQPSWPASGDHTGVHMSPTEGFLGIGIHPLVDGVRVTDIEASSPAEHILQIDDEIRAINGFPVTSMASLRSALAGGPGASIEVDLVRNTQASSVRIRLTERPEHLL